MGYYGGYFDWPRGSTGEEIAESMGIAAPTMHQHLRRGLQEILRDFFDEDGTDQAERPTSSTGTTTESIPPEAMASATASSSSSRTRSSLSGGTNCPTCS
ncbi:helix-turn-helix domain-containing protein [Saliphagus sp. GCM10025308]